MTNPLFKVTLALLSLISAVLIGQSLMGADHQSSGTETEMSTGVVNYQPPATDHDATALSIASARVNLLKQSATAGRQGSASVSLQVTSVDTATSPDNTANRQQPRNQENRRSFSFHYLDILEWMFAGRNDKAKHQPPQRPSTSLNAR